jgi:hypothetical protein
MRHDLRSCPFPGLATLPSVRAEEALNADEENAVQAVLSHVLRCGGPNYLQALAEAATARQAAGHQALRRLV